MSQYFARLFSQYMPRYIGVAAAIRWRADMRAAKFH